MTASVDTVIIETADLRALAAFYQRGLDLPAPQAFGDDHVGFRLPGAYFGFDLVDAARAGAPGPISLWFGVPDLEATFERFVALGAKIKFPPAERPWGDKLAAVFDPDGNVVGLVQR